MAKEKKPLPDLRAALKSASEKIAPTTASRPVVKDDGGLSLEKLAKAGVRTKNFPKK